jgi:NADH:ubiquinone oxidoreductase subunit 5 (subunit L)/multisubunit Na+/H+ antiporter MnhA subunit
VPFFLFFFLIWARFQTTALADVTSLLAVSSFEYVLVGPCLLSFNALAGFLLAGAIFLKSAQFVFYPWLLDAMEAPVPISAQLHSSTLVVIGFYLFFRFSTLFFLAPSLAPLFIFVGLLTALGASFLGFFQEDGKRLLACSTAGQLGYVITSLGLGYFEEAQLLLVFCCINKAFTFV